jgi:hypothetical protein
MASVSLLGVSAIAAGIALGVGTPPAHPAGQRAGALPEEGVTVRPASTAGAPVTTPVAPAPLDGPSTAGTVPAATSTGQAPAPVVAGQDQPLTPEVPSVPQPNSTPVQQVVQPVLGLVDGLSPAAPGTAVSPR